MLKGKRGLLAAVLTLTTLPAIGADLTAPADALSQQRNPALPSPDDLIRFDTTAASVQPAKLDALGANQRAFPLFYGAPAAAPGTLIAAIPANSPPTLRPAGSVTQTVSPGVVQTGQIVHSANGAVTRTFVSVPIPLTDTDAMRANGFVDYDSYRAQKQNGGAEPETASAPAEKPEPLDTSVASAMPHAGGETNDAPPTLGAKADSSSIEAAGKAAQTPVASAPATMAMAPSSDATQARTSAPAAPSLRPDTAPVPEKRAEPEEAKPETESHFPATLVTPPPLPAESLAQTENNDSHPTVGLAEFKTGTALDGTPLPPPPPMPELPGRPKEIAPVVSPDPSQVRADFNRLKAFCEEDSLGSAAEIYSRMPDFGDDEEINRLRADAANLLILGLARNDNLGAARRIFNSVPATVSGYDANLAKTRGIINLATYYVRADRFNDAYEVVMDLEKIENRSALNNELFRLMARMIPYLDNADESEKARTLYDLLLTEVKSPGTASLFADNIQGVLKYYLHYVDKSENPVARRKRMDFLEHMYSSMEKLKDNPEVRMLRGTVGMALADRYAGDPERAAKFLEN